MQSRMPVTNSLLAFHALELASDKLVLAVEIIRTRRNVFLFFLLFVFLKIKQISSSDA